MLIPKKGQKASLEPEPNCSPFPSPNFLKNTLIEMANFIKFTGKLKITSLFIAPLNFSVDAFSGIAPLGFMVIGCNPSGNTTLTLNTCIKCL